MTHTPDPGHDAGDHVASLTHAQLVALVRDLAREIPEVAGALQLREMAASGDVATLTEEARLEIAAAAEPDDWDDHRHGCGDMFDLTRLRTLLRGLIDAGAPDRVLELAFEMLEAATRRVEMDHDALVPAEFATLVPEIADAVDASSLTEAGRLRFVIDLLLADEYDLLDDLADQLRRTHGRDAWHEVADHLLQRLATEAPAASLRHGEAAFRRRSLVAFVLAALDGAGREEEALRICEREARQAGDYVRLVERLTDAGRLDDAERWIREGISATAQKLPGVASALCERLVALLRRRRRWPEAAAVLAEQFVQRPSVTAFEACREASEKAAAWAPVRATLLAFLAGGPVPRAADGWPLPPAGVELAGSRLPHREGAVQHAVLIEIAIHEDRPADVLHWYDACLAHGRCCRLDPPGEIATAVAEHDPGRAVALWQEQAEELIARKKPDAYRGAVAVLRQAATVMKREGRREEWERYVAGLKQEHARKRRFLAVLAGQG